VQHVGKIARQQVWVNGVEIPVGASYEDGVARIREVLS
jgi:hypothetical protein